jgi:hypothetical protein
MPLPLARSLSACLIAMALTASLAGAQDRDADPAAIRVPARHTSRITWPIVLFSAGAAADWTSTAVSLSHPRSREDNPLIAWAKAPPAIIATGAAIDAVGAYAWMKSTTHHHRLRAAGFVAAAAFRSYLVIHNIKTIDAASRTSR